MTKKGLACLKKELGLLEESTSFREEELLASSIAGLIGDARHVAVGASSPIPAAAAMLARERGGGRPYVSLLGSRRQTSSPTAGANCSIAPARDGSTLLSVRRPDRRRGQYQSCEHRRLRASEGALPRLVRIGLSLLCGAEGDPVPSRAHPPHLGGKGRFHQRAGASADNVHRPGGPCALITNCCLFAFDRGVGASRSRACIPGIPSPRSSRTPASPSIGARTCRRRRRRRARICAFCERRWRRSWSRSTPVRRPCVRGATNCLTHGRHLRGPGVVPAQAGVSPCPGGVARGCHIG